MDHVTQGDAVLQVVTAINTGTSLPWFWVLLHTCLSKNEKNVGVSWLTNLELYTFLVTWYRADGVVVAVSGFPGGRIRRGICVPLRGALRA